MSSHVVVWLLCFVFLSPATQQRFATLTMAQPFCSMSVGHSREQPYQAKLGSLATHIDIGLCFCPRKPLYVVGDVLYGGLTSKRQCSRGCCGAAWVAQLCLELLAAKDFRDFALPRALAHAWRNVTTNPMCIEPSTTATKNNMAANVHSIGDNHGGPARLWQPQESLSRAPARV